MTDALDEGLIRLAATGPSYWGGLANHGPMVVETLDFLDVSDAIDGWVGWYRPRLEPFDAAAPAYRRHYADALAAVEADGWPAVLRARLPRLVADCAAGSAGHGLLRVAHAVRALERNDTPARRAELAHGLAYWAWTFQLLPGSSPAPHGSRTVVDALAALPVPDVTTGGFFTTVLPAVALAPGFADAVDSLAAPDDVNAALSDVTEAAARAYLANSAANAIALVHAVTIPSALRLLLPYLDEPTQRHAFAHAWQTAAAMIAGYGAGLAPVRSATADWSDVIPAAVAARDDHAIKLAGACRVEHARKPSPIYVDAAADVAVQLDASQPTP